MAYAALCVESCVSVAGDKIFPEEAYGFIRLPGGATQLFIALETIAPATTQADS